MGLNFDKSNAQWAYSGFNRFRDRLAECAGFKLTDMQGHGGLRDWSTVKDPIKPLLDHSDCDGSLGPTVMAKVAPRLLELIKPWPEVDYDKQQGTILAKDMLKCAKKKQRLNFC